jgi:hypothetical protein
MSDTKVRAMEIYQQHIALASTDPRIFRKTVREQLMRETGCSDAAASTHYNNCKKAGPVIEGLGRAAVPKGLRKPGAGKAKPDEPEVDDDECFTVIELVQGENSVTVGRCQSFILQGDASEKYDSKVNTWSNCTWVLIKGLGPNHGDAYKVSPTEHEIKRHNAIVNVA